MGAGGLRTARTGSGEDEGHLDFGKASLDPTLLEARISSLMEDDEVQRRSGIYAYVLDGEERHLGLRTFPEKDKLAAYEKQKGICVKCGKHFEFSEMAGDHIVPWSKGGKTGLLHE